MCCLKLFDILILPTEMVDLVDLTNEDWKKKNMFFGDQHVLRVSSKEIYRASTDSSIFCQHLFWWRNEHATQTCLKIEDPKNVDGLTNQLLIQ